MPISDKLSPSEFKLLKYLIENKERLCTKDEIINSVWTDQKTQEGVTDQALDQIFYRLRKKIEKDPTSPHYIHTIKGKGYKLSD
jgi:DNA-binding response OmpR family regulator